MKNIKRCKWILIVATFLLTTTLQAITVTKTYSGSTVEIDNSGNYGVALPSVSFATSDFPSNSVISKVTVSIDWTKTDGTCANPNTGNAYHGETSFRLDGPLGNVILAVNDTWSGGTDIGDVTTTFDQTAANIPSGTPVSGTFKPNNGHLNAYIGGDPVGSWNLSAGDDANNDPLCVHAYSVSITVVPEADTDGDGVYDRIDLDDDNDGILDTTEEWSLTETNATTGHIADNSCFDRTFTITQSGIIHNSVTLDTKIDHTWRGDLVISLISPQGTSVDLTSDNGGSVDNLYVLFDDTASTSVVGDASGQPPTQTLSPEEALLTFNGENTYGTWTLHICDDAGNDVGTFNETTLLLTDVDRDTDGDGVVDRLDLDSDNDGIPDTVEAQPTDTFQPIASPPAVDGNGIPTEFAPQGIAPIDTDSDGFDDYVDKDSDNDQVSDCIEGFDESTDSTATKTCPVTTAMVGTNGLTNWMDDGNDNYDKVYGILVTPIISFHDYKISTSNEVSYRESSPCGNELVWNLKANQWKTISAPCAVADNIGTVFAALGTKCTTDNINEQCNWDMFKQSDFSGNRNTGYTRLSATDTMSGPVSGYWIITDTDINIRINENDTTLLPNGVTAHAKQQAVNHAISSPNFDQVYPNLQGLPTTTTVQKVFLGNPYSGAFNVADLFISVDTGSNYYPLGHTTANTGVYNVLYIYDAVGTDTSNYVAKSPTPGFGDIIEKGVGFWLGVKANSGGVPSVRYDIPYTKVK